MADITNTYPNLRSIAAVNVAASGTAVQVSASSVHCKRVDIQAKPGNTGNIYIGGSDVSSTKGIVLTKGTTYTFQIEDLSQLWIDAATNGDGITGIYYF